MRRWKWAGDDGKVGEEGVVGDMNEINLIIAI